MYLRFFDCNFSVYVSLILSCFAGICYCQSDYSITSKAFLFLRQFVDANRFLCSDLDFWVLCFLSVSYVVGCCDYRDLEDWFCVNECSFPSVELFSFEMLVNWILRFFLLGLLLLVITYHMVIVECFLIIINIRRSDYLNLFSMFIEVNFMHF